MLDTATEVSTLAAKEQQVLMAARCWASPRKDMAELKLGQYIHRKRVPEADQWGQEPQKGNEGSPVCSSRLQGDPHPGCFYLCSCSSWGSPWKAPHISHYH